MNSISILVKYVAKNKSVLNEIEVTDKLLSSFYLTQIASLFLPMMPVGTKYLLGISSLSLIKMAVMNFATF